jgi:TonB family protein
MKIVLAAGISLLIHGLLFFPFIEGSKRKSSYSVKEGSISVSLKDSVVPLVVKKGRLKKKKKEKSKKPQKLSGGIYKKAKGKTQLIPNYPYASRKLGEEGVVVLLVTIDKNGRVVKSQIKESSGYSRLDQEAIRTAREGLFEPAHMGNETVESHDELVFRFKLE